MIRYDIMLLHVHNELYYIIYIVLPRINKDYQNTRSAISKYHTVITPTR